jgi:hypothetical protein
MQEYYFLDYTFHLNKVVKTSDTLVSYLEIFCVTFVTSDVKGGISPACR